MFADLGDHNQNNTTLKIWPTPTTTANSGGAYDYASFDGSIDGISGSAPDTWYAFSTGNVRVYVIDGAWAEGSTGRLGTTTGSLCGAAGTSAATNCQPYQADADEHWQPSSAEYKWLAADLAAHPGGIKFAVFQFPMRSDVAAQPSDLYTQNSSANPNASTSLEALLSTNGVDMTFSGHAHAYQRFIPRQRGQITSYDVGTGGGVLEPVDPNGGANCQALQQTNSVYAIGWSPTTNTGTYCGATGFGGGGFGHGGFGGGGGAGSTPTSESQVYSFLEVSVSGTSVTVTPVNAAGQSFDVQTYYYPQVKDTTPPTVPTNVVATATSDNTVQLTWSASTDSVGVLGYDIYRNGTFVGTVNGSTTSYTDTPVTPSTTYQYTVDAYDGSNNVSQPSTAAVVTTPAPPTTPTLIQSASSTTTTVGLQAPSAAGDLLVLSASLATGTTNHITAVTDSAGNVWHRIGATSVSGHSSDGELWYTSAAAPVTSVTAVTAATSVALEVQEYSGIATTAPLDPSSSLTAGSGTSAVTGSITPDQAGELAVGFVAGHGSSQAVTPPSGYTAQAQVTNGTAASLATGYQVLSAPGPQSFGGTFAASMYWAAGLAFFAPAVPQVSTDTTPPTVPGNVQATATAPNAVQVTWSPSTDNVGVLGYDLYRNGTFLGTVSSSTTSYTDTPVTPSTTYQYTVDAYDGSNNVSQPSAPATVTTPAPPTTPTLIQSAGSSTTTVGLQTPSAPGDLLVLSASLATGTTNHITAVTDSAGNVWQRIGAAYVSGHNSDGELWYTSGAAPVTSVTVSTASTSVALEVQEFSGVAAGAPLDPSSSLTAGTGTSAGTGPVTPAQSGELAVGFVAGHASSQAITVSSGYTAQAQVTTGTSATVATGYEVLPAPGSQSFGGVFAKSMYWAAGLAFFAPAG